jgi:hypothetical protein
MNTKIVGRIYHVVDKTTNEVIKVGSTIQTLKRRFRGSDYQKKYINHFLREVRTIESSEQDWYEPKNLLCPFMWHLVAAEHLEILKMGTFQKGPLSNHISPLVQKSRGLGGDYGSIGGRIGGLVSGNNAVKNKTGIHAPDFDRSAVGKIETPAKSASRMVNLALAREKQSHEDLVRLGQELGQRNVNSGWAKELGRKYGRIGAENGHLARISHLGASLGATTRNHNQYHVKRGVVSSICKLCNIGLGNEKDSGVRNSAR